MSEFEVSLFKRDPSEIPEVSFADYLLNELRPNLPQAANVPWLAELTSGHQILFGDVEELSRKIASALTRLGLKRGDMLQYITYNMTQLYVVILAAWRIGITVRGAFQGDEIVEYERQLRQGNVKVVIIDSETATLLKEAVQLLEWEVQIVSVGTDSIPGAISFDELISDDGSAFPDNVNINPREDVLFICNTSGSTGVPKGAMLTHYAGVAMLHNYKNFSVLPKSCTTFSIASNYLISSFLTVMKSFCNGNTLYVVLKFRRDDYIKQLLQCKAGVMFVWPYLAAWFARSREINENDFSFLKIIAIGGAMLDPTTISLLRKAVPNAWIATVYGMTELMGVSSTAYDDNEINSIPRTCEYQGTRYVATGKAMPYVRMKIVDVDTGKYLGRMKSGEIYAKGPYMMIGYLTHHDKQPLSKNIDQDGWLHTGDLGFLDQDGYLYVQERKSYIIKYFNFLITPTEIESVLANHPAVREAGVVGIPNPKTTNVIRAYVVLKPGHQETENGIKDFVAKQLPTHLHLHGGVRFIDNLPVNRGGKLDRAKLKERSLMDL